MTIDEKILNSQIGARLKIVRNAAGYSQASFSMILKTSLRSYQNYERGERGLPAPVIADLYGIFLVDPIWLLTGHYQTLGSVRYDTALK